MYYSVFSFILFFSFHSALPPFSRSFCCCILLLASPKAFVSPLTSHILSSHSFLFCSQLFTHTHIYSFVLDSLLFFSSPFFSSVSFFSLSLSPFLRSNSILCFYVSITSTYSTFLFCLVFLLL